MKNKLTNIILALIIMSLSANNVFADQLKAHVNNIHNLIHLIGENHYDPGCIEFKNQLADKAKEGKIILALEGEPFGREIELNILGIEEESTHTFLAALDHYQEFALYEISKKFDVLRDELSFPMKWSLKEKFKKNSFFFPASRCLSGINSLLASMQENLLLISKMNPEIVTAFFNLFKLSSTPIAYEEEIVKLTKNHSFETPFFFNINADMSRWLNLFINIIHVSSMEAIRKNELISTSTIKEAAIYVVKLQEYVDMNAEVLSMGNHPFPSDFGNFENFIHNLKFNHRNRVFVKNIITLFENNKYQEKPFYVVVGLGHVSFLYEEFRQKGYEVELNELAQRNYDEYLAKSLNKTEL